MYKHKTALIIVDVQNDFVNGALAVKGASNVIPVINSLLSYYDNIVCTQDWHPENHVSFAKTHKIADFTPDTSGAIRWPVHCVKDTHGALIHGDLKLPSTVPSFKKGTHIDVESYSGFGCGPEDTGLASYLRAHDITHVDVVGLALDYCVMETALDARKHGFVTSVITDATMAVNESLRTKCLETLSTAGIKLVVSSPSVFFA